MNTFLTFAYVGYLYSCKLSIKYGSAITISLVLLGICKPMYLIVPGCDVNIMADAVVEAQRIT